MNAVEYERLSALERKVRDLTSRLEALEKAAETVPAKLQRSSISPKAYLDILTDIVASLLPAFGSIEAVESLEDAPMISLEICFNGGDATSTTDLAKMKEHLPFLRVKEEGFYYCEYIFSMSALESFLHDGYNYDKFKRYY